MNKLRKTALPLMPSIPNKRYKKIVKSIRYLFSGEFHGSIMQPNLCLALAGTPGCGKTTLAEIFSNNGANIISVKELALQYDCLGNIDLEDEASEIDIHKLVELWENENDGLVIVDGHLSHFLDVDGIILLRCNPTKLEDRLSNRGYSDHKINSNKEWELISGTWSELLEFEIEVPIIELDTTTQSSDDIYQVISEWIDKKMPSDSIMEQSKVAIDWMSQ